jgi:hypothetical protein
MVADMTDTYTVLDIDPDSLTSLEGYLLEYFERILKKLREQDYKKPKVSSPF